MSDELVGLAVEAVRPARPNGHGWSWEALLGQEEQIRGWVGHPVRRCSWLGLGRVALMKASRIGSDLLCRPMIGARVRLMGPGCACWLGMARYARYAR